MIKFLSLLALMSMSFSTFSQTDRKVFECKLKIFPKVKKIGIKFLAYNLADEELILKLPRYYTVNHNSVVYSFSGALSQDDECTTQKNCRMVVYIRVGDQSPTVGYANNSSKTGALNEKVKFSCTMRDFRAGETDVMGYDEGSDVLL